MRFMVVHTMDEASEAGAPHSAEVMAQMGRLTEEMVKAGVLLATEGLLPSSEGARVSFSGGRRTVIDGPFAESKELIAGFALLQVRSKEEAIEWASRFAASVGDVEMEVRQVAEASDVGPETSPA